MRKLFCLLLLVCLPFQALASFAYGEHGDHLEDVAHELAHDNHESHYHHEDGSVTYDQSEESTAHMSDHCVYHGTSVALATSSIPLAAVEGSPAQVAVFTIFIPERSPDGLLRPPKPIL